jgi:hypothetical protein
MPSFAYAHDVNDSGLWVDRSAVSGCSVESAEGKYLINDRYE